MRDGRPIAYGRPALIVILLALLLMLAGVSYVMFSRFAQVERPVLEPAPGGENAEVVEARRLMYVMTILLTSVLLILIFVVGSYLLIRVGRMLVQGSLGGTETRYVDAWANYRIDSDQIAAATQEDSERSAGRPPRDDDAPPDAAQPPPDDDAGPPDPKR